MNTLLEVLSTYVDKDLELSMQMKDAENNIAADVVDDIIVKVSIKEAEKLSGWSQVPVGLLASQLVASSQTYEVLASTL